MQPSKGGVTTSPGLPALWECSAIDQVDNMKVLFIGQKVNGASEGNDARAEGDGSGTAGADPFGGAPGCGAAGHRRGYRAGGRRPGPAGGPGRGPSPLKKKTTGGFGGGPGAPPPPPPSPPGGGPPG